MNGEAGIAAYEVCAADALADGGDGVRVAAMLDGDEAVSVFFIRFDGAAYGYLNRCAHQPAELDWNEGQFFESGGAYLICSMHGALFAPDTGNCESGPCYGGRLRALRVEERDTPSGRRIYWLPDADLQPAA